MLLKHYLERGVSKAELSRRFGVSRRTIHEWVETGQLDRDLSSGSSRYSPRPPAPQKLDPYTAIIDSRLEEFPGLSAKRLFDEVRTAGYAGGYTRVRDYVRAVRPREPAESVVRYVVLLRGTWSTINARSAPDPCQCPSSSAAETKIAHHPRVVGGHLHKLG